MNFTEDKRTVAEDGSEAREIVLPLFAEEFSVSKRVVPKGRVQVSRITHEHEQLVNELLGRERVEIERVAIGKPIETMPKVREEGDTIIVPVVEEALTIERRLILKEEVRIRKVRSEEPYQERITIRNQEAIVTRAPVEARSAADAAGIGLLGQKKET